MKLLRHLAGYLPVKIASGIAAFGGVYVFTRLLGPEEYGRYALMVSVLALIHTLSLTPAEAAAYRFAGEAEAKGKQPDHFRTTLSLTFRSLVLTAALIGALAFALGRFAGISRDSAVDRSSGSNEYADPNGAGIAPRQPARRALCVD